MTLAEVSREFAAKEARYRKLWQVRLAAQMAELPEFDAVYREVRRALRQGRIEPITPVLLALLGEGAWTSGRASSARRSASRSSRARGAAASSRALSDRSSPMLFVVCDSKRTRPASRFSICLRSFFARRCEFTSAPMRAGEEGLQLPLDHAVEARRAC